MPYGVVPSLLATTAPSNHPAGGREWADYHSTHINTITSANATGVKLFQNIVLNTGVIRNDYSDANLVWVMNNATKMKILAESIGVNSGAAIVAGMGDKMPVVGGDIVTLEFIPDDTVIYGYFGNNNLVNISETITKILKRDEIKEIFNETDVMAAPSIWYETFGFTVLEAVSYGVPVIISDRVGAKDIVGENGVIVKAGDPASLKEAIESIEPENFPTGRIITMCGMLAELETVYNRKECR